jgi:acyl-CoA thioesterase-2
MHERPFEFRPVYLPDYFKPEKHEPIRHVWLRAVDRLPEGQTLHRSLLAYVSDYHLLETATLPHAISMVHGNVRLASIDHAMWFHADVRVDEWLLYSIDSPSASGARGFARGCIFARDGKLVASTSQEGLIRVLPGGK